MVRVALLAGLLLAGCGGDDAAELPDAGFNCEIDQRDEEFTAGMEKVGAAGMTIRLVSSSPSPPSRYENDWVVEVVDAAGAPLAGAELEIKMFMPDHGHFSSIPVVITEDAATPGRYQANPNLFMPGIWEITVRATPAGGAVVDRDEALFTFCVAS